MNTVSKEARREQRNISTIGRLLHAAASVHAADAKRDIINVAEDMQRAMLMEIMERYELGQIAPSEVISSISRLDSLIGCAVAAAAQAEEEAAYQEEVRQGEAQEWEDTPV